MSNHSKKYNMSYKLMMRLIQMVEAGDIKKYHPLIHDYEGMKRELENTKAD